MRENLEHQFGVPWIKYINGRTAQEMFPDTQHRLKDPSNKRLPHQQTQGPIRNRHLGGLLFS